MTSEQRQSAIAAEVARGDDALRAARVLAEQKLFADAVSRAYYAALHYARALLITRDLEPRTHAGVHRMLSLEFVRHGLLSPQSAKYLSNLEKQRSDADYTSETVFDEAGAREEIEHACALIDEMKALLASRATE